MSETGGPKDRSEVVVLCIARLKNALRAAEAYAVHDPDQAEEHLRVAMSAAVRRLARRRK